MAPGGIRPRLARLTKSEMKTFVSQAVQQAKQDPDGQKLLNELNKSWASALKAYKEYEQLAAHMQKVSEGLLKQGVNLDPQYLDQIQRAINDVSKRLKPISDVVGSFEKTEDLIAKRYRLNKVAA